MLANRKTGNTPAYDFISILINDDFFKGKRCFWGPKGKTFMSPNKKIIYPIDFFCDDDWLGILYYTDYLHAYSKRYRDNDLLSIDGKEYTALEIRQRDEARKKFLEEEYGIKLYIVWESEFINNKDNVIDELFYKIMEEL